MSGNQLQVKIEELLSLDDEDENVIINRLDKLIRHFGTHQIQLWRNSSNRKWNSFLHELVEKGWLDVVSHAVREYEFDINVKRQADDLTPFQLAQLNENSEMCDLLLRLGADSTLTEDVETKEVKIDKDKIMNIVWLDLEMTSLEDPHILECAVIITNKDLQELERGRWVVHFEQSVLDGLGDWHQKAFKGTSEGGNGLFADVVASKITKEEVERELLTLLKRHCPEKMCPLAGSSIHIDKEVLKQRMPEVHNYLHYRIIDVSSFRAMIKRWAPWTEGKFIKQLAFNGQAVVNHRAMDDIEWSIEFMKLFRPLLTKQLNVNKANNRTPPNRHNRSASLVGPAAQSNEHSSAASRFSRTEVYADEKRLLERLQFEETFDVNKLKLDRKERKMYDQNPHLREVFINRQQMCFDEQAFTNVNRLLKLPHKLSVNIRSTGEKVSTTEYWGQRKLLLTEIEFLTSYVTDDQYLVIYAGAAPGSHINYLSSLFPNLGFVLIDSKDLTTTETDRIQIRPINFTDDLAKEYSTSKIEVLFICNVRTFHTHNNLENNIMEDIANQKRWHQVMKPRASLLNFRLPRAPGKTSHFKGSLLIEPWASRRNIECRLVVEKDAKLTDYGNADLEEAMLHFQNVTRTTYYNDVMGDIETEGLDHCYDCRAEIFILQQYLVKCQNIKNENDLRKATAAMSAAISRKIMDKNRKPVTKSTRTLNVIPKM